ncbi:MAG: M28 family peptidase [Spirochaetes bacterium]|nr:M28 family peptidase [Spirochaetota bacterium]
MGKIKKIIYSVILLMATSLLSSLSLNEKLVDNLYSHVSFLVSGEGPRNNNNTESLNSVSEYIKQEFIKSGYSAEFQEYEAGGKLFRNVICSYGNQDLPVIVLGAHYDVFGNFPGADDNASGIAGLIEIARITAENKPELNYRIEFTAYSTEEPPFFGTVNMGSAVHAGNLFKNNAKVKLAIVLEMIGYFSENENSQQYPAGIMKLFYPNKGNFIAVVGRPADKKYINSVKKTLKQKSTLSVKTLSAPSFVKGIDFSDHRNYWKYGYNAIMITDTAFFRNPNYHKKTDTIDTLDFNRMAEVVKGVYFSLLEIK